MKCSQIRKMISPYVDDELNPEEKRSFIAHVTDCPACKKELEEIEAVNTLFASAERFEAPAGFATRVMANLEERKQTQASGFWSFFTLRPFFLRAVEVAFALVVIFIGVFSGNLLMTDRTSEQQVVQATVQESFSLDLFRATPSGSIGGAYMQLMGAADER